MCKKVMVVEDNELMRSLAARVLKRAGYAVVEAVDGTDALDKLDCSDIVAVVTDFHMPRMDGVALIREMQKVPGCLGVPVVVMSADVEGCRRVCGDGVCVGGWLAKPFMGHELVEVVERTAQG
jgi:two-component system chemotaxis response regulator CheY